MTKLGIVDYGMGNRRSVEKALEHVGVTAVLTSDRELLRDTGGLVIPGVGAFPKAMRNLDELGLSEFIRARAADGVPILGLCLGMQLLLDSSEELEPTAGLGLIPGEVRWLTPGVLRIPHIGWNEVRFERPSPLTAALPRGGCPFYHVHSLAVHPAQESDVLGSTDYGERFATIVARGNVFGVQFHPEKSSTSGLRMLENFAGICAGARAPLGARA